MTNTADAILPGSTALADAAKATTSARGHKLRRWSAADKAALATTLEYVRRSYKVPAAVFPRLVAYGTELVCGSHHVAKFSTWEIASAAETIARQAAEACGLKV